MRRPCAATCLLPEVEIPSLPIAPSTTETVPKATMCLLVPSQGPVRWFSCFLLPLPTHHTPHPNPSIHLQKNPTTTTATTNKKPKTPQNTKKTANTHICSSSKCILSPSLMTTSFRETPLVNAETLSHSPVLLSGRDLLLRGLNKPSSFAFAVFYFSPFTFFLLF